jgi:hypothetical protein
LKLLRNEAGAALTAGAFNKMRVFTARMRNSIFYISAGYYWLGGSVRRDSGFVQHCHM